MTSCAMVQSGEGDGEDEGSAYPPPPAPTCPICPDLPIPVPTYRYLPPAVNTCPSPCPPLP